MLKALELAGFKSFADKTRLKFPTGITVVVGPNGSGKSNVVDAIKWVLGEQSVKSLRGKEMADVIFNGSPTRRGMNSAEITLTLDNSKHLLAVDTPEVHITRRVYRSGEGEYLINRQPCRLRDIRELLSGTGMGTQAYSVIEQGKVDVLLQSSPRDRRMIFEEAAGISRFKLKKLESLRRLERVDQNLLRLSDIVDEVESRLRSVRLQAGKARRYKQHTERLQELRTQVGLVDWRRLSERLAGFEGELEKLRDRHDADSAEMERVEAQLIEIDTQVGDVTEAIRQSEAHIASNRAQIATQEATIEHERTRARDLDAEISRNRRQLATISSRAEDLARQLRATTDEVQTAERSHREIAVRLAEGERELTGVIARLDQFRGENQHHRDAAMEQMRAGAAIDNQIGALDSELAAAEATARRCRDRLAQLDQQADETSAEIDALRHAQEESQREVDELEASLAAARDDLKQTQRQQAACQEELAELRQRHGAASERAALLEELHRRQEGLSAGVKDVLALAADPEGGPFRRTHGLLADLLRVSVEIAPLVEVALGQAAQHVVADRDSGLLELLQQQPHRFSGRVGFVWLDETNDATTDASGTDVTVANDTPADAPVGTSVGTSDVVKNIEGQPGVLGRADRFVETDPRFARLVERLLGRTWIVEKLGHAVALARATGPGQRFVTLAGEMLGPDGTLIVGPQHTSTGLISRRSQLRAIEAQLADMQSRIDGLRQTATRLGQQIDEKQQQVETRAAEHHRAAETLAEQRTQITVAQQQRAQFDRQREVQQSERRAAELQRQRAAEQLETVRAQRREVDAGLAEMDAQLVALNQRIQEFEKQRQSVSTATTETKVELAKSEERLRNLQSHLRQLEEGREERRRALVEGREQLALATERARRSAWSILQAESAVAELFLHKESLARATVKLINRREASLAQRGELAKGTQGTRQQLRQLDEKIHAAELAASDVRHQRGALADRLREDYGIELAELEHHPSEEERHQRDEVQAEIDELRQKIGNLGNVNLEALDELDQLEGRHETLAGQHKDLSDAKRSLEQIIERINTDSRRLFSETFQTVRDHFQTLFCDLFGGGHADILLDEEGDILDSGIEIVARPPGKEPRNISLLSGGEKTLTCVALLLAIFRSRPSPFCVLDEVDAALDEANIDRFTQVIQQFLAWTQFIIVTHCKKTMTCADTIYGVTMQESGVSKQVSVRFDDVSDDGQILPERLARASREEESLDDESPDDETQAA